MAHKVLVVDDEPTILMMTAGRLRANGYRVITAESGTEALEKVSAEKPDIMLIDIMMPTPDGYEVCQTLKTNLNFSGIPIILFTAKTNQTEIEDAMACGADDYIIKPFSADVLLAKVKKHLTSHDVNHDKSTHT